MNFEEEVRLGQHGSRGVRICTDLIRAINSAQIPRSTDSVRLGKFGTNFEVFYCCINYCTAALNSGTCPEICTACQLYGRCLIWHGNRGTVRLGFEGQFVYLMLKRTSAGGDKLDLHLWFSVLYIYWRNKALISKLVFPVGVFPGQLCQKYLCQIVWCACVYLQPVNCLQCV